MKFVKGLTIGLLSLLLFLSLSTFGLALTLNHTILNPDFAVSELDSLDVPSLAADLIDKQVSEGEFSEELGTALVNTITKLEPLVKEQAGAAIYSIYDYLLGKSQSLDLALTLRDTILSQELVVSLVNELDISSLATEFLKEQLPAEIPKEIESYLMRFLDDAITELEPWLKEQVAAAADPILDYLLGERQSFNIVISLEPVKEGLKENLREAFLETLPPELTQIPPAVLEQYFNQFYEEISGQIPSTFEFNESLLRPEVPAKISETLAAAESNLEQARQAIGYFQLGYKILIGFILLLILGIILLNRQVRSTTRELGVIFLTYGALEYIGILIARSLAGRQLLQLDIPPPLQSWLPQFFNNLLAPLEIFSIGLLSAGIVLIIVSFIYKPRQPSF